MKRLIIFIICFIFLSAVSICAAGGVEQASPFIQWMRTTAGMVINAGQVSMTQTVAVIKAAPATGHYRYSLTIRNIDSANTVYIGGSGVTSSTGFPLKAGESFTLDRNYAAIYGICDTGLTATVAYFEEAN